MREEVVVEEEEDEEAATESVHEKVVVVEEEEEGGEGEGRGGGGSGLGNLKNIVKLVLVFAASGRCICAIFTPLKIISVSNFRNHPITKYSNNSQK